MAKKLLKTCFKNLTSALFLLVFSSLAYGEEKAVDGVLTIQTQTEDVSLTVELAQTPEARSNGLMYRKNLSKGHGMLFDFKTAREVHFWMKNTFIPLDMYFIRSNGDIAYIHPNARPHDETIISSPEPVRWVLEVAAGSLSEFRIEEGDKVVYKAIKQ